MSQAIRIRRLERFDDREIRELGDVLTDCVEGGASVSFMLPMTRAKAERFWRDAAASAARGERIVIVAEDASGSLVGTVTVIWAQPENQPHRADVAKMLVHRRVRRQGVGAALLAAAEQNAREAGKTLLVLDTVTDTDAYRLYMRQGWQEIGEIPSYALWPDGRPCPTTIFYKSLRQQPFTDSWGGTMTTIPDDLLKIDESAEAGRLAGLSKPFAVLFERGDLTVELFAPRGIDTQTPHERDEVYIISYGTGLLRRGHETVEFKAGDLLFVPAGVEHRFERFSAEFRTWVIFFGPPKLPRN